MRGRGRINAPFCYQTLPALEALREEFRGRERAVALALYTSLTELSNEQALHDPRKRGFTAERKEVAERAGTSTKTVSTYVPRLEEAGLLLVHRTNGEALEWELLEPQDRGSSVSGSAGTREAASHPQGSSVRGGVTQLPTPLYEEEQEEGRTPLPPAVDAREPKEVSGKPVTPAEHDLADGILAAFNRVSDSDFRAKRFRVSIIGRIRERPELDLAAHEDVIARNFANPWWKDDPSPAVIYGNESVFERCLNARGGGGGPKRFSGERRPKPGGGPF